MENPGIDPGTSHMLSERSTTWANSPAVVSSRVKSIYWLHVQQHYAWAKEDGTGVSFPFSLPILSLPISSTSSFLPPLFLLSPFLASPPLLPPIFSLPPTPPPLAPLVLLVPGIGDIKKCFVAVIKVLQMQHVIIRGIISSSSSQTVVVVVVVVEEVVVIVKQ